MNFQFICMSNEYGRDGTADYTKLLSEKIQEHGHETHLSVFGRNDWLTDCKRLKSSHDQLIREALAFQPDVISWQYDGHLFSPRAIYPPYCVPDLHPYCPQIHVMIHEIWEGVCPDDPATKRIKGFIQRSSLKSFVNKTRPNVIHTSNGSYHHLLAKQEIHARLLPLFSNIPVIEPSPAISEISAMDSETEISFVLFGGIHAPWAPEPLMRKLTNLRKKPIFRHIGRMADRSTWERFKLQYSNAAKFEEYGERSPDFISGLIHASDFAISTYNLFHLEKSGIFACFVSHGIPVIVNRIDRSLPLDMIDHLRSRYPIPILLLDDIPQALVLKHTRETTSNLGPATEIFLHDLMPAK